MCAWQPCRTLGAEAPLGVLWAGQLPIPGSLSRQMALGKSLRSSPEGSGFQGEAGLALESRAALPFREPSGQESPLSAEGQEGLLARAPEGPVVRGAT